MTRGISGKRWAYLGAIVTLLVPLSYLSRPSTITAQGERDDAGGYLARLRDENNLQHSNLGDLDPSTITLKLATFGVRQVAAALLRNKAEEYKSKQNWTALEATLDQAANLQPYYVGPWRYQAWNLSYNVSVEFDGWEGRYHYVKRGIKYLIRGARVNRMEHRLLSDIGWFTGQKFGRSDERIPFRRKFRLDADEEFPAHDQVGRPVKQRDNWLVAREYYTRAENLVENAGSLGTVSPTVFYTQGPRCLINYAEAIGRNEEVERILAEAPSADDSELSDAEREARRTRRRQVVEQALSEAWKAAHVEWRRLGIERNLPASSGGFARLGIDFIEALERRSKEAIERLNTLTVGVHDAIIAERLEQMTESERALIDRFIDVSTPDLQRRPDAPSSPDEDTMQQIRQAARQLLISNRERAERAAAENLDAALEAAQQADTAERLLREAGGYREQCNYDYWLDRCEMESSPATIAARLSWHDALAARDAGNLVQSQRSFEESFDRWVDVMKDFPKFERDAMLEEEIMDAINQYGNVIQQRGVPFPEDTFKLMEWLIHTGRMTEWQMQDPEAYEQMQKRRQQPQPAQPTPE